jgi:hypothetical protein
MVLNGMLCFAMGGLSLVAFGQNAPRMVPLPSDPFEMATGQVQVADTLSGRIAALQLLTRARGSFNLRSAGRGYDLKISFAVDSGGQTDYDGVWKMEDIFDPRQGLRWTAEAVAGYTVTRISTNKMSYGEGTTNTIPLRLHEARAALFNPLPSAENIDRASIRTSTATFDGAQVTCVLLSGSGKAAITAGARSWEESEECIDPQSGLLRIHSQVPGRYYAKITRTVRFSAVTRCPER